jgi:hypothetical protein
LSNEPLHHPENVTRAVAAGVLYRRTLVVVAVAGALLLACIAITTGITVAYVVGLSQSNHRQLVANAQANESGLKLVERLLADPNNQTEQQRKDLVALCKAIPDCDVHALKFGKLPPVPSVNQIVGTQPTPTPTPGGQGKG